MTRNRLAMLCLWGCLAGCAEEEETPPQETVAVQSTASAVSFARSVAVADTALWMAGGSTPERAAQVIAEFVMTLDGAGRCAEVTRAGRGITIEFGPPPGCVVAGVAISGTFSVSATRTLTHFALTLGFEELVFGDTTLDGTLSLAGFGATFDADADLVVNGVRISADLGVTRGERTFTLDGPIVRNDASASASIEFEDVVQRRADCYPSSGSISISQNGFGLRAMFRSDTPTTGKVLVSAEAAGTFEVTLPPCNADLFRDAPR